jgi:glycosyltransferase involved in cell wall biosynthesis
LLQLPADRFIIGVPSTFRESKGQLSFIKQLAPYLKKNPEVLVSLSGAYNNRYASRVMSLVRELNLENQVNFAGEQNNMITFYSACDMICICSRTEAFGRSVLEAYGQKRPVLAARVGGMVETIEHGITGYHYDLNDAKSLSKGIIKIRNNPDKTEKIVNFAAERVVEVYAEEKIMEKVFTTINDAKLL